MLLMMSLSLLGTPLCARSAAPVLIGQILPNATLRGINGPATELSSFRGRALLINVWASWCGPCREEMASLERLAWREGRRTTQP